MDHSPKLHGRGATVAVVEAGVARGPLAPVEVAGLQEGRVTDRELDEAVAVECFGWKHLTYSEAAKCGDILMPHDHDMIVGQKTIWANADNCVARRECCDGRWSPTEDARDTEKVLEWICRRGKVQVHLSFVASAVLTWNVTVCNAALLLARKKK